MAYEKGKKDKWLRSPEAQARARASGNIFFVKWKGGVLGWVLYHFVNSVATIFWLFCLLLLLAVIVGAALWFLGTASAGTVFALVVIWLLHKIYQEQKKKNTSSKN